MRDPPTKIQSPPDGIASHAQADHFVNPQFNKWRALVEVARLLTLSGHPRLAFAVAVAFVLPSSIFVLGLVSLLKG